jgi:Flp pilus assembly pilin Flp
MKLFQQLWADDAAAILSTELILILAIVVFGIIPGLVAIRNSTNAALTSVGNVISVLAPQVTVSQIAPGQFTLVFNFNPNAPLLTAVQVAPVLIDNSNDYVVIPAP